MKDHTLVGSIAAREQHFKDMNYAEPLMRVLKANSQFSRRQMYINCWHMNPAESDAMWHRYTANGKTNEGVAIRTTLKRLKDCFIKTSETIFIGQVSYIDYANTLLMSGIQNADTKETIPAPDYGGNFRSVLLKRNSFEHEKELRCLFWQPHIRNGKIDLGCQDIDTGHYIQVDLDSLIESVYIAPNAGAWFRELIENTRKKNAHAFQVFHSELAEDPIF